MGMRLVRVDPEVFEHVGKVAKPFEPFNGALRRALGLPERGRGWKRQSTARLSTNIDLERRRFVVEFEGGPRRQFLLPEPPYHLHQDEVGATYDRVVRFIEKNGATPGQVEAAKKALRVHGLYLRNRQGSLRPA